MLGLLDLSSGHLGVCLSLCEGVIILHYITRLIVTLPEFRFDGFSWIMVGRRVPGGAVKAVLQEGIMLVAWRLGHLAPFLDVERLAMGLVEHRICDNVPLLLLVLWSVLLGLVGPQSLELDVLLILLLGFVVDVFHVAVEAFLQVLGLQVQHEWTVDALVLSHYIVIIWPEKIVVTLGSGVLHLVGVVEGWLIGVLLVAN